MLVGLDVTLEATLSPSEFTLLGEHRNDAATFLDAPLRFYGEFGSTFTADTPCHDSPAHRARRLRSRDPSRNCLPVLPSSTAAGTPPGATVVEFPAPFFVALEGSLQSAPEGFASWRIAGVDVALFRAACRAVGDA